MLKVYWVYNYISVDGADWRQVGHSKYTIVDEELETELILDNASFDEVYAYLTQNPLNGLYDDTTLFKKKPKIQVDYSDAWDAVFYRSFNTLSYKKVYEEMKNVTMSWLMEHTSADEFIQYLKERGITACPMRFKGE